MSGGPSAELERLFQAMRARALASSVLMALGLFPAGIWAPRTLQQPHTPLGSALLSSSA